MTEETDDTGDRTRQGFAIVLPADARSPEIPDGADIYGWLVGSWALDVVHYRAVDVTGRGIEAEAHFSWVLEGRVIQDVWIMPQRSARAAGVNGVGNMYGTTLRVWDPAIQAWRITWMNPAGNHFEQQIGRRSGRDIVQVGQRPDGTVTRWRFTAITDESFRWLGEALQPDGASWTIEGEFLARRMK